MFITSATNVIAADFPALSGRAATRSAQRQSANADLRVMLLTDDLAGCDELPQAVRAACGHVEQVGSVDEAISRAVDRQFDLILVDLPSDQWGEDAIRAIRTAGVKLPLLLVSAASPAAVPWQVVPRGPVRLEKFGVSPGMDVRDVAAVSHPRAAGHVVNLFGCTHSRPERRLVNAGRAPSARSGFAPSCSGTFAD